MQMLYYFQFTFYINIFILNLLFIRYTLIRLIFIIIMGAAQFKTSTNGQQQIQSTELLWQVFWFDDFSIQQNFIMLSQFQNHFKIEIKSPEIRNQIIGVLKNYWRVIIISSGKLKQSIIKLIKTNVELQQKVTMFVFCGDILKHQNAKQYRFVKGVYNQSEELKINIKKTIQSFDRIKYKRIQQKIVQSKKLQQTQLKFIDNILKSYNKRYRIEFEKISLNYYEEIFNSQFDPRYAVIHYPSKISLGQFTSIPKMKSPYSGLIKNNYASLPDIIKQLLQGLISTPPLFQQFNNYVKIRDSTYYDQQLELILKLVSLNFISVFNEDKTGNLYRKIKNKTSLAIDINAILEFSEFFSVNREEQSQNAIVFVPYEQYITPQLFRLKVQIDKNTILYAPKTLFIIRKIDKQNNLIYVSEYPINYYLKQVFSPEIKGNQIKFRYIFKKFITQAKDKLSRQLINLLKLEINEFYQNNSWTKSQSSKRLVEFRKRINQIRAIDTNNQYQLSLRILEYLLNQNQQIFDQKVIENSSLDQKYNYYLLKITRKLFNSEDLKKMEQIVRQIYPLQNEWHVIMNYNKWSLGKMCDNEYIKTIEGIIGQNNKYIAEIYFNMALRQSQDIQLRYLKKSLAIYENIADKNNYEIKIIEVYLNLASIFQGKQMLNEARLYFNNALCLMKKNQILYPNFSQLQQKIAKIS